MHFGGRLSLYEIYFEKMRVENMTWIFLIIFCFSLWEQRWTSLFVRFWRPQNSKLKFDFLNEKSLKNFDIYQIWINSFLCRHIYEAFLLNSDFRRFLNSKNQSKIERNVFQPNFNSQSQPQKNLKHWVISARTTTNDFLNLQHCIA